MNVLEVVCALGIGGTERTCINFALGLKAAGHKVQVFSIRGGEREYLLKEAHIPVYHEINALSVLATTWTPDVIHIHSHGVDTQTAEQISTLYPSARICEQNVFAVPSGYKKLDVSFQLSTWCNWNYLSFCRNLPTRERLHILPNPVNVDNFHPITTTERNAFRTQYGIPSNAIVLLRIGQPIVAKWNIHMIDIFADFKKKHSNAFLLCVGAPENVKSRVSRFDNIKKSTLFIDKLVDDNDLRNCYGSADIFFHMARIGESFGIVLAEAQLCELPIVTVHTPYCDNSQAEVVGHERGGLVANHRKSILAALDRLASDQTLRRHLGEKGRTSALERFSINHVISKFEKFMSTATTEKGEMIPLNRKEVFRYLNKAIDAPIPLADFIFVHKRQFIRLMPEKVFRYAFRLYCRIFDSSVQL